MKHNRKIKKEKKKLLRAVDISNKCSCFSFLLVPDVEVKGESAAYFLLVQCSDNAEREACRVRMLHSDSQINGAAAMATVSALLREKPLSSSGILCGKTCRRASVATFTDPLLHCTFIGIRKQMCM